MTIFFLILVSAIVANLIEQHLPKLSKYVIPVAVLGDDLASHRYKGKHIR